MLQQRSLSVRRLPLAEDKLAYFRFGKIGDKVIVTTDAGDWHILSQGDFEAMLAGSLTEESPAYGPLKQKGFLRDGLDADALALRLRRKKAFLGVGPHLHIVIATLRCNQSCKYCTPRAPTWIAWTRTCRSRPPSKWWITRCKRRRPSSTSSFRAAKRP